MYILINIHAYIHTSIYIYRLTNCEGEASPKGNFEKLEHLKRLGIIRQIGCAVRA
jgi:hypothetical protein